MSNAKCNCGKDAEFIQNQPVVDDNGVQTLKQVYCCTSCLLKENEIVNIPILKKALWKLEEDKKKTSKAIVTTEIKLEELNNQLDYDEKMYNQVYSLLAKVMSSEDIKDYVTLIKKEIYK